MSIVNYTYDEFGTKLNELVSVAQPIQSIQHLLGREAELAQISKALFSPGRSIFIYGYRGVGKSSLAASAANQYQSPDNSYIDISCSPDTTLLSLVINIANEVSGHSLLVDKTKSITKDLGLKYLSFKNNIVETPSDLNNRIKSISDAISLLKEVSEIHSERPIVVVDEFDRIESDQERGKFADLLKQLGDKKINLKFIFTGVASTLSHLLGSHASTIRQLETIELSKLNWSARWDILVYAAKAFDIEVDEEVKIRIAAISDGYPYYVHLSTEKLLWRVFDGDEDITVINKEHFNLALHDAINGISASLKQLYDLAVNRRELQYEVIIWVTADSEYL
jgi:AAA+ ATPase superfamily predicted ATPase